MSVVAERLLRPDVDLSGWDLEPERTELAALLELDGVLDGAELLDVRVDAMRCRAGLLFWLAGFDVLDSDADAGVLVASGVRGLSWSLDGVPQERTAWTVGGWTLSPDGDGFVLRFGADPGADLVLTAGAATLAVGTSPYSGAPPPDYVEDDEETVRADLLCWSTAIEPVAAVPLPPPAR